MKNNKKYIIVVALILLTSILYKVYKVIDYKNNKITKEVVTIYLKNNEIKDGIVELIENFNDEHEDIYIRLRLTNDDFDNLTHTKLANKYDIDIFEYNGRTLLDKNFIKPLSSINLNLDNIKDNSFLKVNDEIYGVKYGVAMQKLMYNSEMLNALNLKEENLPKTLDELIALLEDIKAETGKVPLEISLDNIHDIFSIVGAMSTSENTTYSTFWNYKTGEYDFKGLESVINKLNYMYENRLINEDFDKRNNQELYEDFASGETAIIPVNYYKKYSVMDRFEGFDLAFSNIPKVSTSDKDYYYTYSRTLVLANNDSNLDKTNESEVERNNKHNEAVKYVFEWLLSTEVTSELMADDYNFASFNGDVKIDKYKSLNDNKGYVQNINDPTEVLAGNSIIIKENIVKMIKGEIDSKEGIKKLSEEFNNFIANNSRNKDIDFSRYKEINNEE